VLNKLKTKILNRYEGLEIESRIAAALARAAATATTRQIDPTNPMSWEFAGFSQHGEDGIHDYLISNLKERNRFFFEIGSADGLENCTSWFAVARSYAGVMVEGNPKQSKRCWRVMNGHWVCNVHPIHLMVDRNNIASLMKMCMFKDPDLFVIDIDGIDYYILQKVLEMGFRPKVLTVEYNSAFGPDAAITVPYRDVFDRLSAHPSGIYYGASVSAWRKLLTGFGYQFLTVDASGVNAFFADPAAFSDGFLKEIRGCDFTEGVGDVNGVTRPCPDASGDMTMPKRDWQLQFKIIKDMEFVKV
jgi:hypothetical protein